MKYMPEFATTSPDKMVYFTTQEPPVSQENKSELFRFASTVRAALAAFSTASSTRLNSSESFATFMGWALNESSRIPKNPLDARNTLEVRRFVKQFTDIFADINDAVGLEEKGDPNKENRTYLAQINQRLAQDLYRAMCAPQESSQRKAAEFFVSFIDAFCTYDVKFAPAVKNILAGARAQAGIMKALRESGCYVLVPNPDNESEVREWDVDGGVDFAAISPEGHLYLIDAKARNRTIDEAENSIKNKRMRLVIPEKVANRLHQEIAEGIRQKLQKKVAERKIGEKYFWQVSSFVDDTADKPFYCHMQIPTDKKNLGTLGQLSPEIGNQVVSTVVHSTSYHQTA